MNVAKKSVSSIFMALFLSLGAAHAQTLRQQVCIVRGNLASGTKLILEDAQDSLQKNGYTYYANYISSYLAGTFGSGFVWYAQDAKPYIVTNRHVVKNYETADVIFENADGSTQEFKKMRIVFSDEAVDIALVELPATFTREGLSFSTKSPADGDEVFSAGFPGLAGEPSWQLGQGIVSNASVKVKELLDPSISHLIQHTAQVDGGNSGGPLLIKNASSKTGYSVVGINTWSAQARQNTNFAIPAELVAKIVQEQFIQNRETSFDERITSFATALSKQNDFTATVPYISNALIERSGERALRDVLATSPSSVRSFIADIFEADPLEGLRYALAYSIYTNAGSGSERLNSSAIQDETTGKSVQWTLGKKSVSSFWILEHGSWKLSEFEGIKDNNTSATYKELARNNTGSSFSLEDPYFISFAGGYMRNLGESSNGFLIEAQYRLGFVSFGMGAITDAVTVTKKINEWSSETKTYYETMFNLGPKIEVKVPLRFGALCVAPFVEGRVGISFAQPFGEALLPFFAGFGAGAEVALCTDWGISPFIGAKYIQNAYFVEDESAVSTKNIALYLGIKILEK